MPMADGFYEFDRPGHPYLLVAVNCGNDLAVVVLDAIGGRYRALSALMLGHGLGVNVVGNINGTLTIDGRAYYWDGSRLRASS